MEHAEFPCGKENLQLGVTAHRNHQYNTHGLGNSFVDEHEGHFQWFLWVGYGRHSPHLQKSDQGLHTGHPNNNRQSNTNLEPQLCCRRVDHDAHTNSGWNRESRDQKLDCLQLCLMTQGYSPRRFDIHSPWDAYDPHEPCGHHGCTPRASLSRPLSRYT